jgi:hypothetical protein
MYTVAVAGCFQQDYTVQENGQSVTKQNWMVECDDLMQHVANARAFVMHWSTGKETLPKHKVLQELKRLDETIRQGWSESFRKHHDKTYSQCINMEKNVSFTERQWNHDFSLWKQLDGLATAAQSKAGGARPQGAPKKKPGDPGSPGNRDNGTRDTDRPSRRTRREERGDRRGGGQKDDRRSRSRRGRSRSRKAGPVIQRGKLGDKTVKVLESRPLGVGKFQKFCKHFHGSGGCRSGDDCKDRHQCDIVIKDGDRPKACDQKHKRSAHTGESFPF